MKRHDSPSKEVSQEGGGIIGLGGNLGGKTRPQVDEKLHENGPTQYTYIPAPLINLPSWMILMFGSDI